MVNKLTRRSALNSDVKIKCVWPYKITISKKKIFALKFEHFPKCLKMTPTISALNLTKLINEVNRNKQN